MSKTVIEVENLSKLYRLGAIGATTFKESFQRFWYRLRRREDLYYKISKKHLMISPDDPQAGPEPNTIWALKDVSFSVNEGEIIGIIGNNGSGKSTLLKILSRITAPTKGKAIIRGRVGSLLEVGTGFHQELTGRENIYLNGAILGMKKAEIEKKFDEIVAFAELEKFIDTPVKRYSSGMYVRLAFAVAAHLEPEVLLVDEVLAVGDAAFQKKCLGKMGEVAKEGRTVLFVSHNIVAIYNLCNRSILLESGRVLSIGLTTEVINTYMEKIGGRDFKGEIDLRDWKNRYGTGEARILSARLLNENNLVTTVFYRNHPMSVEFTVDSSIPIKKVEFSVLVTTLTGIKILHLVNFDTPHCISDILQGRYLIRFLIPNLPLCSGRYNLILGIHKEKEHHMPVDVVIDVLSFFVEDTPDSPRTYKAVAELAYCWAPSICSITRISE